MAGAKRLAQLAKKWQRVEALGRKRLTVSAKEDQGCCSSVPAKGHCVMYTADGRLLRRSASAEVESALLSSMVTSCHYTGCAMPTVGASQQICCL
ncbi:unnamed protein product [Triticum turgidum subsp. durum]|uniref:Uncharacterized protein n=1 Tax=Triticum turgidum subsp. durum TaxID=4567 RepID=A0A9R1APL6_TRITD|nr:unnamed protein product [Triticum turgidum subsp. durum]